MQKASGGVDGDVRELGLQQILKMPKVDPFHFSPEAGVANMRDVFDVMSPQD